MRRIQVIMTTLVLAVTLLAVTEAGAAAGDAVSPGSVLVEASYESIGVVWKVSGDQNLNSSMTLEFRTSGATTWQSAAPAMRAYPSIIVNGSPLGLDQWGASALFLEAGTSYELRLTINDPDGGASSRVVSATLFM